MKHGPERGPATGVADAAPGPDPYPHAPDPEGEHAASLPDYWQARQLAAGNLAAMEAAELNLIRAHDAHADAERHYRKQRFEVVMQAKEGIIRNGVRVKLTETERKNYVDAATADAKWWVNHRWGLVEAARGALTRMDRVQATGARFQGYALQLQYRQGG